MRLNGHRNFSQKGHGLTYRECATIGGINPLATDEGLWLEQSHVFKMCHHSDLQKNTKENYNQIASNPNSSHLTTLFFNPHCQRRLYFNGLSLQTYSEKKEATSTQLNQYLSIFRTLTYVASDDWNQGKATARNPKRDKIRYECEFETWRMAGNNQGAFARVRKLAIMRHWSAEREKKKSWP